MQTILEKTTKTLAAQGGVMKQFAKFMESAKVDDLEPLEKILKAFNGKHTDKNYPDFPYSACVALSLYVAAQAGEVTEETRALAVKLGFYFRFAVSELFQNAPLPEIKLVAEFLNRIYEHGPSRPDVLTIMRELVAEKSDPKNIESAAALSNLSGHLDAAEPGKEEEDVPETTLLERAFNEYREISGEPIKVTLQVWNPIKGGSDDGIEMSEDEFKWIIDRLRRRRRGEEDPEAWVKRIVTAIFRPHDSPKPLVETGELVPDPDAMEECLTAIRKAVASVKPHAEPKAQAVASADAQALVDEMLATFDKLTAVLARQKEAQPQE